MITSGELDRIVKGVGTGCVKMLFWHGSGGSEENHETLSHDSLLYQLRFEPGIQSEALSLEPIFSV
jgi:hypothetical protein